MFLLNDTKEGIQVLILNLKGVRGVSEIRGGGTNY
jgi:hypothetical protein